MTHVTVTSVTRRTWTGEAPVTTAEGAFRYFNRVDEVDGIRLERIGYDLPSMSVGDIVTLDGRSYRCESMGFTEL